jgi:hypothetical protein
MAGGSFLPDEPQSMLETPKGVRKFWIDQQDFHHYIALVLNFEEVPNPILEFPARRFLFS